MNTPNKLTLIRALLVPVFMVFLLFEAIPYGRIIATFIFSVAAITDSIDGYLARKNNEITDFGKFLDPLADKLLIIAALVSLVQLGLTNAWIAMIIIARELMVTSIRLIASSKDGAVIAAGIWGKLKTISQIVAIVCVLLEGTILPRFLNLGIITMTVAAFLTVYSGYDYFKTYRKYITFK